MALAISVKRSFFICSQVLLLFTALGKLIGAARWTTAAGTKDPVLPFVSLRQMLILAAMAEIVTVIFVWRAATDLKKCLAMTWLSGLLLIYRLGIWVSDSVEYCPCLGYWASWLRLSKSQVDLISKLILAFFVVGTVVILAGDLLRGNRAKSVGTNSE